MATVSEPRQKALKTTREKARITKAAYNSRMSMVGRDIGGIPPIGNLRRRNSSKKSLKKFCLTYLNEAFDMPFCPIHNEMIHRIEEAVLHGALYAFACPRGTGKTTICRAAALWAISYAHCRYVYFIGANQPKALDALSAIKTWIRFQPDYVADFPEIAYPVSALEGIAMRASGQLCGGESTMIEWAKEAVTLPSVPSPPNLKGYKGKPAPTSGTVLAVSGLTGDGIRGSLRALVSGGQLRPDFVLLDDPQTDESAKSNSQNETRERLLAGAVLGMAGPGKKISAVMPCTVIQRNDMVDKLLDRQRHPLWRGMRTRMIDGWPENMNEWEKYFEVYRNNALLEPPNFTEANKYYRKHRKVLDAGCVATWPSRRHDDEVSAIQHAMNLYCRDPIAFASEYQNEPREINQETEFLGATELMMKQHPWKRNEVPLEIETIKAAIDVQKEMMFVSVWGYSDRFDGYLLNYFTWPEQPTNYYTKSNISQTLKKKYPGMGLEARLYAGLMDVTEMLFAMEFRRQGDKSKLKISRVGVDSGYKTATVRRYYRDTRHMENVTLIMGVAYGAKRRPLTQRIVKAGDRKGAHWFYSHAKNSNVRTLDVDSNFWKTFVHQRFATHLNDPGCFSLYQVAHPQRHRLFADHLAAEYRVQLEGPYGKIDEWSQIPNADNDFLDTSVYAAAIASFDGVQLKHVDSVVETNEIPRIKAKPPPIL